HWKELASLNVEELHLPQDGRFIAVLNGVAFSLTLATLPALDGEALVIGIQQCPPDEAMRFSMEDLELEAPLQQQVETWLKQPSGLILVAGPTGSGKDTTIHTLTAHVNTPDRKVVVFDDPTELRLPGALQFK
ncbi:ATPase, T2SS/T4P/T4SS family, partial [Xanthomonas citri pv. citri]